jgi:hypothetical protein
LGHYVFLVNFEKWTQEDNLDTKKRITRRNMLIGNKVRYGC